MRSLSFASECESTSAAWACANHVDSTKLTERSIRVPSQRGIRQLFPAHSLTGFPDAITGELNVEYGSLHSCNTSGTPSYTGARVQHRPSQLRLALPFPHRENGTAPRCDPIVHRAFAPSSAIFVCGGDAPSATGGRAVWRYLLLASASVVTGKFIEEGARKSR